MINIKKKFNENITVCKNFGRDELGKNRIKLTTFRYLKTVGLEDDKKVFSVKCSVNDEKLENNISRAKAKIYEYAMCNEWDWFFTGTIDSKKFSRTDLPAYHKSLVQFIKDYNKKYHLHIKFLFIPELHQDGQSWHMHGFLKDLPVNLLHQFVIGDKMGGYIAEKVKKGEKVYKWVEYFNKFGFCDLEPIQSKERACSYVMKYVTKSLSSSVKEMNAHLYYCSRGLSIATIEKKGTMFADIVPNFENEWVKISNLSLSDDELYKLKFFID